MAHLASIVVLLHLHFFYISGAGAVNLTIANNCSQTIWAMTADDNTPAVSRTSGSGGDEVRVGSSITIQLPNRWNGRVWGKTGCIFNESGSAASCATGDNKPFTLAEFSLNSTRSLDLYDVSLVDGYNLPLQIQPNGGCESTGCIADVNQRCPPELRTAGGAACRSPCDVFGTPEYCCNSLPSCGPTNYSRLFKEVCPRANTYPKDDASSVFACSAASRYTITFCPPPYNSDLGIPPAPTPDPSEAIGPTPFEGPPVDQAEENGDGKKRVDGGLIAVSFLLVFIAMTFALVTIYFHKNRPNSENGAAPKCNRDVENLLLQYGSLAPKRYTYSEIEKITNSLRDKLGSGGYGSVYKGVLPDGRHVAVKILVDQNDTDGEEFVNEVVSIGRTYHVNIVSLLGFCYDYEGNKRALVYEFMPNSSLDKYLTNNGCLLDMAKLNKIAVGIAKGLEYLHTGCITRIVHFDIKPQNILLDKGFCPKISDFGLAKLCKTKQSVLSVVGMRGTIGYIAPEVFSRNFGGVSHKSDVYSYGMMLLEMAGAKKGMQAEANHSSENYFPDKIYEQVMLMGVNSNEVMEEGEEGRKKLFLVGFWCIQTSPLDRPSISKVVEMLEGSVEAIQIPPKPFLFSPPLIPDHCTSSSDYTQTHNSGTVV